MNTFFQKYNTWYPEGAYAYKTESHCKFTKGDQAASMCKVKDGCIWLEEAISDGVNCEKVIPALATAEAIWDTDHCSQASTIVEGRLLDPSAWRGSTRRQSGCLRAHGNWIQGKDPDFKQTVQGITFDWNRNPGDQTVWCDPTAPHTPDTCPGGYECPPCSAAESERGPPHPVTKEHTMCRCPPYHVPFGRTERRRMQELQKQYITTDGWSPFVDPSYPATKCHVWDPRVFEWSKIGLSMACGCFYEKDKDGLLKVKAGPLGSCNPLCKAYIEKMWTNECRCKAADWIKKPKTGYWPNNVKLRMVPKPAK